MTLFALLGLAAGAAAACALALVAFIRWAAARRIVAVPNARSSHTRVTPVGGGAPMAVFILGAACVLGWRVASPIEAWWPAWAAGAVIIVAVSWLDDVRGASTGLRLAAHAAAAVLVVSAMGAFGAAPAVSAIGAAAAVFWIIGLTNAYNFMDGIDGIAGIQALAAGLAWAMIGSQAGLPLTSVIGSVTAGASAGFLLHNWAPAKIFMGDVGSALLGFTLATLSVGALAAGPVFAIAGALAIWPFAFDAALTLTRRLVRGENVFDAHRSHLYQRLVSSGWSHAAAATLYGILAACGVALGQVAIARGLAASSSVVLLILALMCVGLWILTAVVERRAGAAR